MGAQFGSLAFASVGVPQLLELLGGFQQAESELLALAPWVSGGDDEMYHASMDSTEPE